MGTPHRGRSLGPSGPAMPKESRKCLPKPLARQGTEKYLPSAVNQRGRERKGRPEIIQKFRVRKWPISSADFPMTPMERAEHHSGPFWEKDFGATPGGPFFSRPLCCTAETTTTTTTQRERKEHFQRETQAPSSPTVDMEMLEKIEEAYLT